MSRNPSTFGLLGLLPFSKIDLFLFHRLLLSYIRSYGTVVKGIEKTSGKVVAIKRIPVEADMSEVNKEINILAQCESDYIVAYYGSYQLEDEFWV